ncbi:exodeoxyribonuclease III [Methanosarcina barkeri]
MLEQKFDIVCIQETKVSPDKLPREAKNIPGYYNYFVSAEKNGYSGVGLFSRKKPLKLENGMGIEKFDREGRFLRADFEDFILMNIYFPNGKASLERLEYKMNFYEAFFRLCELSQSRRQKACYLRGRKYSPQRDRPCPSQTKRKDIRFSS